MALGAIVQMHSDGYLQCCLITTEANGDMGSVHNRQPVIIQADKIESWLTDDNPDQINSMMQPIENGIFDIQQVSGYVNNARHEGPECLS